MSKNHFKRARLCSSDNYELSRRVHIKYIIEEHSRNVAFIEQIMKSNQPKRSYVQCFDKLIPVSIEEVHKISTNMTVIWK